jgi:hypothetical protein
MTMLITACRAALGAQSLGPPPLHDADWAAYMELTHRHRVQGIAAQGLRQLGLAIPSGRMSEIDGAAYEQAAAGLRAAAVCQAIRAGLVESGVDHLFVKGLTLGKLAYGQPYLKSAIDIDLLVERSSITAAARVLQKLGYQLVEPSNVGPDALVRWHADRKESVWTSGDDRPPVDLHSRLADQPRLVPTLGMTSPRQSVEVSPGLTLDTLATPELLAYLAVHGASSAWFRLKWLADFTALVLLQGPDETESLYLHSVELGAGRATGLALLLGQTVLGLPLSQALTSELESDGRIRWLMAASLRQLLGPEPGERAFGTLPIHLVQFFLAPGPRFKWTEFRHQWRTIAANRRHGRAI